MHILPKTKRVVAELSFDEWLAFKYMSRKNKVGIGDMARACIIDAIAEEMPNGIQCLGTEGRAQSGEGREASRGPAS